MLNMLLLLWACLSVLDESISFELDLEMNEEEIYPVLDEASAEIDELDDVLLGCSENAEIHTRTTIKNVFRSNHLSRPADDRTTNHVLGWQIINSQKQFTTNLTYLLIKQVTFKDSGIYYCVIKVPYLSFFGSIISNAFMSNLSKLWSGCQALSQFECLASFKFKLIVRKAKKRTLNPIRLPDEFKEHCFVIKNGKQIIQDKLLSLVAMFLASLIFFLLLFYFIYTYRDGLMSYGQMTKKSYKKQIKKQRNEQINENLEIIKSFEHIKQDEQELLKKLRLEQERLSNKRREDEEFFNRIKSQELELTKRKEQVVKEEEQLLRKRIEFEGERKKRENDERKINERLRQEDEIPLRSTKREKLVQAHLGDEYEIRGNKIDHQPDKPINVNIKGEIKLKSLHPDEDNRQLVELNNYDNMSDIIDGLSKKMKKTRKNIFRTFSPNESSKIPRYQNKSRRFPTRSPKVHRSAKQFKRDEKISYDAYRDLSNLRPFNNPSTLRSPDRPRFNLNQLREDRTSLLKRKLAKATNIGLKDLKTDFNQLNRLDNVNRPLINLTQDDKTNLDVESTIDIRRRNESIFKTKGTFKVNSDLCNKPIRLVVETPIALFNKPTVSK